MPLTISLSPRAIEEINAEVERRLFPVLDERVWGNIVCKESGATPFFSPPHPIPPKPARTSWRRLQEDEWP